MPNEKKTPAAPDQELDRTTERELDRTGERELGKTGDLEPGRTAADQNLSGTSDGACDTESREEARDPGEQNRTAVPSFDQMIRPVVRALKEAGGRAGNDAIDERVAAIMDLPQEVSEIPHGRGKQTEVSYRIAWAKTYLKKFGLIFNPTRGVWKLADQFDGDVESVDSRQIVAYVNRQSLKNIQHSDLTNLESREAFERFVFNGFRKAADLARKPYRVGGGGEPFDLYFPEGIGADAVPVYAEIRYVPEMKAGRNYYVETVQRLVANFADAEWREHRKLIVIFGAVMSDEIKNDLCITFEQPPGQAGKLPLDVEIWDYDDITDRLGDMEASAEFLINPKRMLIENKLAQASSYEKSGGREQLLRELKSAYAAQDLTLFLGAGVSNDAGVPLWGTLIRKLLFRMISERFDDFQLERGELEAISRLAYKNKEDSPLTQMRYIHSAYAEDEKSVYYNLVHEILYENAPACDTRLLNSVVNISTPRRNHIGVKSIVTYNFDNLVERSLEGNKVAHKTIYRERDLSDVNKLSVFHVHGFLPDDMELMDIKDVDLVFSEEDYHKVYRDAYCWSNTVQLNAFRDSTCLFIGCSLTDPNLRRLLDVAVRSERKPRHFAILRKKKVELEKGMEQPDQRLLEQYQSIDDRIREGYYHSLGINIIWIKDHSEVPDLLNSLRP